MAALTTTFALCDLVSLKWHIYVHKDADAKKKKQSKKPAKTRSRTNTHGQDSALAVYYKRLQQRGALCVLSDTAKDGELWVFIVNGIQSGGSVEPPTGVSETVTGAWTGSEESLAVDIQKQFFAALAAVMAQKLAAQKEFVLQTDGFFELNEAKFIFRCPSLTKLNHFEVYLEEEFPTPAFQLHFRVLEPSNLLTVTVDVVKKERRLVSNSDREEELGDLRSSWERLVGLPPRNDHSVVDVWHLSDGLVPRIVAETKYSDVAPWFRAVAKHRHKRRMDDSDGSVGNEDDLAKKDDNEDDADEDEDETTQDQEVETDELLRRPVAGGSVKSKRKRDSADSMENDESFVPMSPDTHVNTPEATSQIIRMTFPHDDDTQLRVDSEVRQFKRRRRGHKSKAAQDLALSLTLRSAVPNGTAHSGKRLMPWSRNGVTGTELNPSQLFSLAKVSLSKSTATSAKPKSDAKPLSVAVSLVESLSHNEQQEALDGRPVKTHPLLQALQNYVDEEATIKLEESLTASVSTKVKLLQTAEAFLPPPIRLGVGRLSVNKATAEQLRLRLCSERFKYWQSDYKKLQYPKNNRYQKKIHQRQLLLEFDEAKFQEYEHEEALRAWNNSDHFKLRDDDIALGIQVAASGAVVTWRQEPNGIQAWSGHSSIQISAASGPEKSEIVDCVQPYLQSLTSSLEKEDKNANEDKKSRRDRRWMSFENYVAAPTKSSDTTAKRIECVRVEEPPKLCVSTLESSYNIEPAIISEYLLRDLHPVAAPKPVDYVIVCPQSPSQWLASLALSYFTCFRSMYAQCHMGDLAPIDLGRVEGNCYTRVDPSNGLLLVDSADSTLDPFANFRSAGEVLNPLLSSGAIKKKQAFSRSAVANVVYLVVPLRRSDVKHKMWALGAFSSGLFGTSRLADVSSWKDSVTLELVYLDDLYEVEVNPSPFVLMPHCFSLYDRVYENVNLKPADVASGTGQSRFLCERLYHLADWRADGNSTAEEAEVEPPYIYGGYLLSEDRKWLACSCTDAIGSILETYMIPVEEGSTAGLESALLEMTLKMLQFFALFGENAVLVITRLAATAGASSMDDTEESAWDTLRSHRFEELIPTAFRPLLSSVLLVQLNTASYEEVQLRENPSTTTLYVSDNLGFAVISPCDKSKARDSSRAVFFTGSDAWKTTSLVHGQHTLARKREARVLKVTLVLALLESTGSNDGEVTESAPPSTMSAILRDFHAQSYLTMHPITMERQSPLPLHLAAISKMNRELQMLETQLNTDPLQMR